MRLRPWRCTTGSATPSWFTRLRSVVRFCFSAKSTMRLPSCSDSRAVRVGTPEVSGTNSSSSGYSLAMAFCAAASRSPSVNSSTTASPCWRRAL
jgi:hypothetical protein